MADEVTPRTSAREQIREFRRVTANAVAELRSNEVRDSFAALSLEELVDQHIDRLEVGSATTPSRLARIRRVRDELNANIEAMKNTPPELFRRHDPEGDVNTAQDGEG